MSFERILTLQQILASENNFIAKNSEKILIEYAGNKIGKYLYKHFRGKNFFLFVGMEIMEWMEKLPQIF